jgi:hypothetical protein
LGNFIRRVKGNQERLKLNGMLQALDYVDDINRVGENTDTVKNAGALFDASKEVDLKVNQEKTKYVLMLRYQKAG